MSTKTPRTQKVRRAIPAPGAAPCTACIVEFQVLMNVYATLTIHTPPGSAEAVRPGQRLLNGEFAALYPGPARYAHCGGRFAGVGAQPGVQQYGVLGGGEAVVRTIER